MTLNLSIPQKSSTLVPLKPINITSRRLFFELVHKARALKHYRRLERRAILLGVMYVFLVLREDFEIADCIRRRIINPDFSIEEVER